MGYRRYCPYTIDQRMNGMYRGPDLVRARQLVAESGTRGTRVDVWGFSDFPYIPHTVPAYIASVLRSLGYPSNVHLVPFERWTRAINRKAQVTATLDWVPDYPAPSSYLPGFFGCDGKRDAGHGCDPALGPLMKRAESLQAVDPARAAMLWTRIDHKLVDEAWWAPTVRPHPPEITSTRLRNYEFNPIGDFVADQAWLR
jgi:peptide/nickel transport system substrate-binding protein